MEKKHKQHPTLKKVGVKKGLVIAYNKETGDCIVEVCTMTISEFSLVVLEMLNTTLERHEKKN